MLDVLLLYKEKDVDGDVVVQMGLLLFGDWGVLQQFVVESRSGDQFVFELFLYSDW